MTGKAVEYLSALKSCGRAPVSWNTRRHCARRHAYGSASPSGRIQLPPPHTCACQRAPLVISTVMCMQRHCIRLKGLDPSRWGPGVLYEGVP